MRHASEFWLLANLIMDRISATDPQEQEQQSNPGNEEVKRAADEPPEPILHEYDQTSMQQVNDLISIFQEVHIQ